MKEKLIEVKGLKTEFTIEGVPRRIIDDISFEIYRGEFSALWASPAAARASRQRAFSA